MTSADLLLQSSGQFLTSPERAGPRDEAEIVVEDQQTGGRPGASLRPNNGKAGGKKISRLLPGHFL